MSSNFERTLNDNLAKIESSLKEYVKLDKDYGIGECMAYSLLSGGKRIRPFIVIESCRLFSGDNFDIQKALPFASALEMIHTYSLIHDDLPCMDDDDLRRGRPTNHIVFGEANALLAGDSLLTYAFEVLSENKYVSDKSIRLATKCLAKYAGYSGMIGGQMIDINSNDKIKSFEDLKNMHLLKTGALIRCAMELGYYAATDNPDDEIIKDIDKYAKCVGIAFQIRDDILDKISDSKTLGKPVGSDEKNGKITSLAFMSVGEAQNMVDSLTNDAISLIEKYCLKEPVNTTLIELAKYMVGRSS